MISSSWGSPGTSLQSPTYPTLSTGLEDAKVKEMARDCGRRPACGLGVKLWGSKGLEFRAVGFKGLSVLGFGAYS